ncbi:MAG: shikimate dehydrogenase [Bosea sp. (in: a-proteobacteria)]
MIASPEPSLADTPKCCVIGHPIAHSRSPIIHGHWLASHGIKASYSKLDVAPDALANFAKAMRDGVWRGANVTVPHKQAVAAHLDELTEAATRIGAANLLFRSGDKLIGDNTDFIGFLAHLDQTVPGWADQTETALILGSGGAARAVVYGLNQRGVSRIIVVNRDQGRIAELSAALGIAVEAIDWSKADAAVAHADLIVNTTSLGMKGQPPLQLDLSGLRPGTIVDDIVYVPLLTPLLVDAAQRGAQIVDGLGMLLHQAAPAFARWFSVTPLVTPELRALVEADVIAGLK